MTLVSPATVGVRLQFDRPPTLRMISTTRSFVEDLYTPIVGSDAATSMAMVVHELMENLTKYATDAPMALAVDLDRGLGHHCVCIATTNNVQKQQLPRLEELLAEIASSSDPRATFQAFIGRSVEQNQGSRLGLARIRAEAGMELRWEVEGTTVTIRAETRLPMETTDGR